MLDRETYVVGESCILIHETDKPSSLSMKSRLPHLRFGQVDIDTSMNIRDVRGTIRYGKTLTLLWNSLLPAP